MASTSFSTLNNRENEISSSAKNARAASSRVFGSVLDVNGRGTNKPSSIAVAPNTLSGRASLARKTKKERFIAPSVPSTPCTPYLGIESDFADCEYHASLLPSARATSASKSSASSWNVNPFDCMPNDAAFQMPPADDFLDLDLDLAISDLVTKPELDLDADSLADAILNW
jgi:hypothetical protein